MRYEDDLLAGPGLGFTRFNEDGEIVDTSDLDGKCSERIGKVAKRVKARDVCVALSDWRGLMRLANKWEDDKCHVTADAIVKQAREIAPVGEWSEFISFARRVRLRKKPKCLHSTQTQADYARAYRLKRKEEGDAIRKKRGKKKSIGRRTVFA